MIKIFEQTSFTRCTDYLVSGHNWPVFGRDRAKQFIEEQRDGIKYMHVVLGELRLDDFLVEGGHIDGNSDNVLTLFDLLDTFPAWFPIASHVEKYDEA